MLIFDMIPCRENIDQAVFACGGMVDACFAWFNFWGV